MARLQVERPSNTALCSLSTAPPIHLFFSLLSLRNAMSTVYESLLPKLVTVLEVAEQAADGAPTQQVKQALVQAVCNDGPE